MGMNPWELDLYTHDEVRRLLAYVDAKRELLKKHG